MDAELGLQRSSTNPPLQTAPEESQMLTVVAGPGSSGSGTNVVPHQIATEEDANQQVTAGTSSDRKRLTGSQKRKLRRQALRANEAACSAASLQSPVASTTVPPQETKVLKGHSPARDEESEEAQAGAPADDEHRVGRHGAFGCSED